ncbi:hypothetical protein [uncultured Tateyamaria sp.]|nr:hypothetical protein [uncultured Tateyamaria sp.]
MLHPYNDLHTQSIYAQEQEAFAKMQEADRFRKRRKWRRQALKWVLRRL